MTWKGLLCGLCLLGVWFSMFSMSAQAVQNVTLIWNVSTNQNVAGYEIFYGATSHTYTNSVKVSGNVTNATIAGLLEGTTYYFGAKTYDATGAESDFSNEATYAVPAKVVVTGNMPPTINPISDLPLLFNAGAQTIGLSGITSGATNEVQKLAITVKSSNTTLITSLAVKYTSPQSTGTLTFRPATGRSGSAIITVTVNDGGKSNNIISRSFTVTVLPSGQALVVAPAIVSAVTNIATVAGQSLVLNAGVTGSGKLGYRWSLNGTPVATTTNGTLTITKLTVGQSGTYVVTVTNSAGTVSGTIAQVTVYATAAATLTSLTRTAGSNFGLQVAGVPGYKYVVQTSTNLVNWTSVTTNTAPFNFQDTGSSPAGRRFYRTYSL